MVWRKNFWKCCQDKNFCQKFLSWQYFLMISKVLMSQHVLQFAIHALKYNTNSATQSLPFSAWRYFFEMLFHFFELSILFHLFHYSMFSKHVCFFLFLFIRHGGTCLHPWRIGIELSSRGSASHKSCWLQLQSALWQVHSAISSKEPRYF